MTFSSDVLDSDIVPICLQIGWLTSKYSHSWGYSMRQLGKLRFVNPTNDPKAEKSHDLFDRRSNQIASFDHRDEHVVSSRVLEASKLNKGCFF